jgi:hypothetical protein
VANRFFTFKLITQSQHMIDPTPEKNNILLRGSIRKFFNDYPQVTFIEGLSDVSQFDGKHRTLLILDALMIESNDNVSNIFTKVSHQPNVSVVYLSQNLFHRSKQNRTMSLNTHYMVLFKNPRDVTQVANLSRQMYTGRSKISRRSLYRRNR